MRAFGRLVAGVVAGLFLAAGAATSALAAPPLWAVRDADSTLYLFGTMHVLTPEAEWRTPAFDKALKQASRVWFEMDVETPTDAMAKLLVQLGFDFKTPLADKVSPKTMVALRAAVKGDPKLVEMIEKMRPWAAGMMVQALPMLNAGLETTSGADAALTRDARAGEKSLRFFETAEQQLRFFADLPEPVQIQFLEDGLEEAGVSPDEQVAVQQAWLDGDMDRLGAGIVGQMRDQRPELYDALIRRRNAAWVADLAAEMAGSGVAMVNVGALHMVGEDGLVAQLKAKGFTVERVQ